MMVRKQGRTARVVLLVSAALFVVLALGGGALAASDYNGGPATDSAAYIPNDHSPVGVRWSAMKVGDVVTGLDPNTTYSVKVRLSPNPTPSNVENRGWTWNPTTQGWVQERDQDWGKFPTVTTDADGQITDTWTFFKFADDTKSGTYYLLVSLNLTKGSTFNNANPPALTVIDMKTSGAWVHNGVATEAAAGKRAEVSSTDATPVVFGVSRMEANGVDDDSNGVMDDEDYGPVGATGDYRFAMPMDVAANVLLNRTVKVADFTVSNPDEDIALGADDMTAPGPPTALSATAEDGNIALSWTTSTDDVGVTGYQIYRWATLEAPYGTPIHTLIATVPATQTTYDDAMDLNAVENNYEVRAVDAATNVSARSNTATVTSVVVVPQLFIDVPADHPFYVYIQGLGELGAVGGYADGTYRPNNLLTRAQAAKMLVIAFGYHDDDWTNWATPSFTDVPRPAEQIDADRYPFDYVEEAKVNGMIMGRGDGTFGPGANITRAQLAVMITRIGGDALQAATDADKAHFTDLAGLIAEAQEAVAVCYANGIINGTSATTFNPYGTATRAHAAKMIWQLSELMKG